MSSTHALPASASLRPHRVSANLPRFAWVVLIYNVAVILWGAVVRATSSGAGCGDHWPLCNGVVVQTHPRLATLIELTHRMTSGVTVIAILLLLVWTFRSTLAGHLARITAVTATVLVFNEALLGALLVLLHLTADNHSPARAVYLSLHLANTLLLLGALTLTAHFLSAKEAFRRHSLRYLHLPAAITGLVAILLVGMTGTLAALSDTLFPATSFRAALAQDFADGTGWLQHLRLLHPASAIIAGLFLCWLLLRALSRPAERNLAIGILILLGLQCALGVADVILLAPLWLQITHLLGADLLWITLVLLAARMCVVKRTAASADF
ncbi:MAG TPA: COX15/CtaA family protein [Acidobacteriaceae bacterium]|nr:COX15/CtaA family protein [Acidobacteriaceae bacterium]